MKYDFKSIEKMAKMGKDKTYKVHEDYSKKKYYCLEMFHIIRKASYGACEIILLM